MYLNLCRRVNHWGVTENSRWMLVDTKECLWNGFTLNEGNRLIRPGPSLVTPPRIQNILTFEFIKIVCSVLIKYSWRERRHLHINIFFISFASLCGFSLDVFPFIHHYNCLAVRFIIRVIIRVFVIQCHRLLAREVIQRSQCLGFYRCTFLGCFFKLSHCE